VLIPCHTCEVELAVLGGRCASCHNWAMALSLEMSDEEYREIVASVPDQV
jgi:predicted ATP-dependent serine protease